MNDDIKDHYDTLIEYMNAKGFQVPRAVESFIEASLSCANHDGFKEGHQVGFNKGWVKADTLSDASNI